MIDKPVNIVCTLLTMRNMEMKNMAHTRLTGNQ